MSLVFEIQQQGMGNQLEKEFNIKEKPLKLPGSYNFLRFAQHPSRPLSLLVVKHPHRAAPIPSTLILPLQQVRPLSSDDQLALCPRCLPLCLVKPKSQTQMRILMHRILKAGSELGRCFFHMGRVVLWCEQKRGLSSISPQQLQMGKPHPRSKVFTSGIALINFLHCVYQPPAVRKQKKKDKKAKSKSQAGQSTEKEGQLIPGEVKLFFDPKDKSQYEDCSKNMEAKLTGSLCWQAISEGLRELLLNMVCPNPDKRIAIEQIAEIPYFMASNQLRIYIVLADQLEELSPRRIAIFLQALEVLISEGLTIEQATLDDFVTPLLTQQILKNPKEGREEDWLLPLLLSLLLELPKPPVDALLHGFLKAHPRNKGILQLGLRRSLKIRQALPFEDFQRVLGRCSLGSFEREELLGLAVSHLPKTLSVLTHPALKKQLQFQLIQRVMLRPPSKLPPGVLLQGIKAAILLVRQGLLSSPLRLEAVAFRPQELNLEANLHALYLWGLIVEHWPVGQLLSKMMPKIQPYLGDPEVPDPLFVVAKRCLERILERLHEQRRIKAGELIELQKDEAFFEMADPPADPDCETKKAFVRKEVDKHQLEQLQWVADLL